jgi:CelD/BcsL family acetyltransferase involved in cellulose biosynthesis
VFRGADGLQNLRQNWHNLVADQKVGGFYHLFEWYESNLSANQDAQEFLTIGVYSGERLLALLPLRETKRRVFGLRVRVLEFPNTEAILHDAILAPGSSPSEIVQAIRSDLSLKSGVGWDFMRLNEIPGASLFAKRNPGSRIPLSVIHHTGYSNIFELEQYRDFSTLLSKNFRAKLRKYTKQLRQYEDFSYDTINTLPGLDVAFDEFLQLEASGWKSRVGHGRGAIKLNSKKTDFYRRVLISFSKLDGCHIHFIRVDGHPIAGAFTIIVNDTCFLFKIAYDERFAKLSPGNLLTEYLIKYYLGDSNIRFINLISNSKWRDSWHPSKMEVVTCYVFNRSILGLLCYVLVRIKSALDSTL